jgi:hypothetical protein
MGAGDTDEAEGGRVRTLTGKAAVRAIRLRRRSRG